ncbi:MAG: lamin tail domain-containing protein [Candidatus Paceibacterota bacterium]|jgi:hypothetical protein
MEEENLEREKIGNKSKFLILGVVGALFFLVSGFLLGGAAARQNSDDKNFLSGALAAISDTFENVFGSNKENPVLEFSLDSGKEGDFSFAEEKLGMGGVKKDNPPLQGEIEATSKISSGQKKMAGAAQFKDKGSISLLADSNFKNNPPLAATDKNFTLQNCNFDLLAEPSHEIILNEIAWMGTDVNSNDEWLELKNNSAKEINLGGWQIKNQKDNLRISFTENKILPSGGFFILERTDDSSVPAVAADFIYSGAMSNDGEWFRIFDGKCKVVDEINASLGWGRFGGENSPKKTLERNLYDLNWHTSSIAGGTPRIKNSEMVLVSSTASAVSPSEAPAAPSQPQTSSTIPAVAPTIIVSEVMVGSSASAGYEFIEIYNYGSEVMDLTGWAIKKKSSSGSESSLVSASRLQGKTVAPGKYILLAHEEEYTGPVSADVLWPKSYTLAYTNNAVVVYDSSGQVADQASWTEIPKDQSYERATLTKETAFTLQANPSPKNSGM